ncbi:MAG TPA: pitrilysin family protein [Vicinamibacterales bacterium]|jgi:zinc protease|nr:pitrilysin family protein [Vicinamibacterales bacterium]
MQIDRGRLPALGADPQLRFPEIQRRTLANGLRVWTIQHEAVPLVSFLAMLPVGASADPQDRPGLAAITSDMLDEGCGDLDAMELHDALGRIGGHLDSEIGSDATILTISSLARYADRASGLLADMITRPRLDATDFHRVRELRLNRLIQLRDLAPALADRAFARLLYGEHPYGHMPLGTEPSLQAITLDEVSRFHRTMFVPSRMLVIAAGDATHDALAAAVEGVFGSWRPLAEASQLDRSTWPLPPAVQERLALLHRPGAAQSELRIGHVGVPRRTPDYHALIVLNIILGGQFVSRINMNLREDKGYTYGARTSFDFRLAAGPFVLNVSVQSEVTVEAILEALDELHAIRGPRPVTAAELRAGRAALTRGYPRNFETADQISRGAAQLALYDLPDDYFSTFTPRVLAVDETAVTRVAEQYIDPSRLVTVIVGDREKVAPALSRLNLGAASELVPV